MNTAGLAAIGPLSTRPVQAWDPPSRIDTEPWPSTLKVHRPAPQREVVAHDDRLVGVAHTERADGARDHRHRRQGPDGTVALRDQPPRPAELGRHRARDVPGLVLVGRANIQDDHVRIVQMRGEPVGRNQRLGGCGRSTGHGKPDGQGGERSHARQSFVLWSEPKPQIVRLSMVWASRDLTRRIW